MSKINPPWFFSLNNSLNHKPVTPHISIGVPTIDMFYMACNVFQISGQTLNAIRNLELPWLMWISITIGCRYFVWKHFTILDLNLMGSPRPSSSEAHCHLITSETDSKQQRMSANQPYHKVKSYCLSCIASQRIYQHVPCIDNSLLVWVTTAMREWRRNYVAVTGILTY